MQPILKYFMVAIQYNLIGLINTQYRCDFQEPTQVTSCCNLLAPVRQLSFNSQSSRIPFSQVQRVFIVEHYLASRSYLTCQNEFRDTFPGSPEPNKSTISRLVNRFRHSRNSSPCCIRHEEKSECMHRWTLWTFPTLNITLFLFSDFNVIYFLTYRTCVRNGLRDFSITLYIACNNGMISQ
jgi:hypothetical protein